MRNVTLVAGIGSAHGDDQIGWIVARGVQERWAALADVCILGSPADLLHRTEGCSRLIVIDAFQDDGSLGDVRRWVWPTEQIVTTKGVGTHSFSLVDVLQMGVRLRILPDAVIIWGIGGRSFGSGDPASTVLTEAAPRIAGQILAAEFEEVAADA